jgi:hypothetical protein
MACGALAWQRTHFARRFRLFAQLLAVFRAAIHGASGQCYVPDLCPVGQYCDDEVGGGPCFDCQAGRFCEDGVMHFPCAPGKYSTKAASECSTCEVGYKCPGNSNRQACLAGTFATGGAKFCEECPGGFYCEAKSDKVACGNGTFAPPGAKAAQGCAQCSPGTFSEGGEGFGSCHNCTAGTVRPSLSLAPLRHVHAASKPRVLTPIPPPVLYFGSTGRRERINGGLLGLRPRAVLGGGADGVLGLRARARRPASTLIHLSTLPSTLSFTIIDPHLHSIDPH